MNKEQLDHEIKTAFNGVKLEDGIGLWEAQGHDARLSAKECAQLRRKDEKNDWSKIPVDDLFDAESSFSFFDAKGLRFHLPQFMLHHPTIADRLITKQAKIARKGKDYEKLIKHTEEQLSALNQAQTQVVIHFLEFEKENIKQRYQEEWKAYGMYPDAVEHDKDYQELNWALKYWHAKLAETQ